MYAGRLRVVTILFVASGLCYCSSEMQSANLASGITSPAKSPTPSPASVSVIDGSYMPDLYFCSTSTPCLSSFSLSMGTFQANYLFNAAIPMTQKGTYIYDSSNGITWTQQSLTMTPGVGQASTVSCTGATLSDNVETDVNGLTCNGILMTADRDVIMPDLMLVTDTGFTNCSSGTFSVPCDFNTYYSYVLQTDKTSGTPGALEDGNYFAPKADSNFAGFTQGQASGDTATVSLDEVVVAGSSLTFTLNLYHGTTPTKIGTITATGTFVTDAHGYMTFTQSALNLVPSTGGAAVLNALCSGGAFTDNVSGSVAGYNCTKTACGSGTISCDYFETKANSSYGLVLTNVDSETISPCSSTFVNCQYDPQYSYVKQ